MARRGKRTKDGEGKDAPRPVIRCDRLTLVPNRDKAAAMKAILLDWREVAFEVARIQWRRFQAGQGFDALADEATDHRKAGAAVRSTLLAQIRDHHAFTDADVASLPARPTRKVRKSKAKPRKAPDGSDLPPRRLAEMTPGLVDPLGDEKKLLGAAQVQMVRRQVVGMLRSFLSNRRNDYRDIIGGSSLDARTRHMLHAVNRAEAWFDLKREVRIVVETEWDADGTATARETIVVPSDVRRLARAIMRHVLSVHRRPSMDGIGMVVDGRIAALETATQSSGFRQWLVMTVGGRRIAVPARSSRKLDGREGVRSNVLSVNRDAETGGWSVGVSTDGSAIAAAEREEYLASTLTEELALDFGLDTLFASDRGDLVGRGFLAKLVRLDDTIQGIARHVQRSGRKPRDSARYRKHVARLRGFVRTEMNRVLNRLIAVRRPKMLVLERLRFTSPLLSARLNRIVSNCGRSVLTAKLEALEEERGVTRREVPCAYSSLTCSNCSYVDRRNRRSRSLFDCRWCGTKIHADVNASRVLARRRSPATKGTDRRDGRKETLDRLVQGHVERWPAERRKALPGRTRGGGTPPDPRHDNPFFGEWKTKVRSPRVANGAEVAGVESEPEKARATSNAT